MTEPAGAGSSLPRAFLRVGGIALARHQLGQVLAMGCQRVICLARELASELIDLQHDAENAGARFHVVSGPRALAGLITANDDLIALGDGLLADPQIVSALLESGHTVLVQPVETGVAAGFERIDLNHASAGAFRVPGRLVEQLNELPADVDVASALTRVAIQTGITMQEVPAAAREGARWRLIRDEAEAHSVEGDWLRLHMGERLSPTPSTLLSRLGMTVLGPSLLHAGSGSRVAALASLTALLIALGTGWLGFPVVGFALCAVAAALRELAAALGRVERSARSLPQPALAPEDALVWAIDLGLVALVIWGAPLMPWESLPERAFPPIMLLILVRLVPRMFDRAMAAWIEDRALLAALLALSAGFGLLTGAVQVMAVVLALAGLLFPGGKPRLT